MRVEPDLVDRGVIRVIDLVFVTRACRRNAMDQEAERMYRWLGYCCVPARSGVRPAVENGTGAQRWLARVAFVVAAAAVVVLLAVAGIRGVGLVLLGAVGVAVCLVAVWWFLVHRGVLRWLAAVLAVAAPLAVAVFYV